MAHIPYVYRLTDRVTGKRYIGSRYAKVCDPSDLGVTYFTSRPELAQLFKADPGKFEKQIIVTGTREYVIKVEFDLIESHGAVMSDEYYNRANAKGIHPDDIIKTHLVKNEFGVSKHASEMGKIGGKVTALIIHKLKDQFGRSVHGVKAGTLLNMHKNAGGKSISGVKGSAKTHSVKNQDGKSIVGVDAAYRLARMRWVCLECGMCTHPGALTKHQIFSGHRGISK